MQVFPLMFCHHIALVWCISLRTNAIRPANTSKVMFRIITAARMRSFPVCVSVYFYAVLTLSWSYHGLLSATSSTSEVTSIIPASCILYGPCHPPWIKSQDWICVSGVYWLFETEKPRFYIKSFVAISDNRHKDKEEIIILDAIIKVCMHLFSQDQ